MKPRTTVPCGTRALVPVMKKPAGANTIAETATAPMPPATPLSSNPPERRIWRPLTVRYSSRAVSLPEHTMEPDIEYDPETSITTISVSSPND